jgi:Holliday junction DNA helicase RuvA
MITLLRGTLLAKAPTEALVDVGGVGYGVQIPVSTFEALGSTNSSVTLHTYLHVREDALVLYGFATEEERDTFRLLISVNGIGPKMAQGILSGIGVKDLKDCIARGNIAMLTTVPGVGRRTGERLVVELREKIGKLDQDLRRSAGAGDEQSRIRSEALLALTSLGYTRQVAEKALRAAIQGPGAPSTIEGLIKSALRHATGAS